jgi:hypothetical protein
MVETGLRKCQILHITLSSAHSLENADEDFISSSAIVRESFKILAPTAFFILMKPSTTSGQMCFVTFFSPLRPVPV